jgi:hypothetical protein
MRRIYRTLVVAGLAALAVLGLWLAGGGAVATPTSAATPAPIGSPSATPTPQSWVDSSINHPTPGPTSP